MHADRLHAGKQRKVPNLPEKMDSTSLNEAEGEVRRGSIKELASGYFRFLHLFFFFRECKQAEMDEMASWWWLFRYIYYIYNLM